jgi:lipoyl(octanoyl) transferase
MASLVIRQLEGLQEYQAVSDAMHHFTEHRDGSTPDELWFLEHYPVFTQGQAGKAEHLLNPGDIPVVQSDRGGQVTYHGPGQLVVYCMVDLARKGIGPRHLVSAIEQAIVDLLKRYTLDAYPKKDAPGVYVNEQKIASLGLRIRKGKSFHGLALNLDMDLEPFLRINPCGYAGMEMTQLKAFESNIEINEVAEQLQSCLMEQLEYSDVVTKTGLP